MTVEFQLVDTSEDYADISVTVGPKSSEVTVTPIFDSQDVTMREPVGSLTEFRVPNRFGPLTIQIRYHPGLDKYGLFQFKYDNREVPEEWEDSVLAWEDRIELERQTGEINLWQQ